MWSTVDPPKFLTWFPAGCPSGAADASGIVFRFVASNPPEPGDFMSHHELGMPLRAQVNPCNWCGLSVHRDRGAARAALRFLRRKYPNRFGPHIAEGTLDAEHGQIKQDGRDTSHHEWWAYEGVERHQPFRVVETLVP